MIGVSRTPIKTKEASKNHPELLPLEGSCSYLLETDLCHDTPNTLSEKGSPVLINSTMYLLVLVLDSRTTEILFSLLLFGNCQMKFFGRIQEKQSEISILSFLQIIMQCLLGSLDPILSFLTLCLDKQEISGEVGKLRLKSKNNSF